jgi:hypothetical protein
MGNGQVVKMKVLGAVVLSLAIALGATSALAAKYTLTIESGYSNIDPVVKVRVKGGKVLAQPDKTRPQPRKITLPVELDGPCYTRVSLWFERAPRGDVMVDICSQHGILID